MVVWIFVILIIKYLYMHFIFIDQIQIINLMTLILYCLESIDHLVTLNVPINFCYYHN